jgi:hypothetical protein
MKNLYTILILLFIPFFTNAQTVQNSQDIIISKKTFDKLNKTNVNHKKLSIIQDIKNKEYITDNPNSRIDFEQNMLIDPKTGKIPINIRKKELQYTTSSASGLNSYVKNSPVFQNAGPHNVGGRTRALAIDVANENTILAGGVSGGLWKSTNNGTSWRRVTPIDQLQSITYIAQDTRVGHRNTWYYCTGELRGNSASINGAPYRGNGLYKSVDNGDTWTLLNSTASNTPHLYDDAFDYCWKVCVNPTNGDVYVATVQNIQKSTDGGNTWQVVLNSQGDYNDVICTSNGILYATASSDGSTKGVFRSTTGNTGSWQSITPNDFPSDYQRIVLDYAPSNTNVIYLLAYTPEAGYSNHSFYKLTYTSPSNFNWENRSNNLPLKVNPVAGYNSQESYNMIVKVAPDNENIVFIGGTNLHRSTNGFSSRTNTSWIGGYDTDNDISIYPNHHPDVHSLAFKSDNTTLLCGHDGGISTTDNFKSTLEGRAVTWTSLNNGYLTTQAYTVAVDPDNYAEKRIISGFQDNGTWMSTDGQPTTAWRSVNSGDGSYCAVTNLSSTLLTSSQRGRVIADFGNKKWTRIDPSGATGQLFINPFITDANAGKIVYYAAGSYVWRNLNITEIPLYSNSKATVNWEKLTNSATVGTISALESSVYPAHILYCGTSAGKIYKIKNSHSKNYRTIDITGPNMPTSTYVSSISSNPKNANEVMISFSNYRVESVFYTNNGGTSWTAISGNLEENGNSLGFGPSVRSVKIVPTPTGTVYYAGTSTGLYRTESLNGASTNWTQVGRQIIGNTVVAMIKSRGDGYVAAGTHANGIYTTDLDFSSSTPTALIGITQDTIKVGEKVNFRNRSIGEITNFSWSFTGAETTSSTNANPTNILYNNVGTYPVSLTVSNSNGSNTQTIETAIVVEKVDELADKLLYNIDSENRNRLTQYAFSGNNSRFITGHNSLPATKYAEKFSIGNQKINLLKAIDIWPTVLQNNSSTPKVTVKVWNGTNIPTEEVHSVEIPFSQLSRNQFNRITFNTPVQVEQNFFVGYQIAYEAPIDSFAVAHLPFNLISNNTAYLYTQNQWLGYNNVFTDRPSTSLAIKALVGIKSIPTSIEDITDEKKELMIYPNPMVNQTKIEFENKNRKTYRLIVVDASGRIVRIINNITNDNVIINREQLKPGLHILNLQGEETYKGKLIVR